MGWYNGNEENIEYPLELFGEIKKLKKHSMVSDVVSEEKDF